ncbi:MAG: hypothetical protein A3205_05855 [Methanomassiliicoccales archaeon Mx-03]|nr:MAG: hypothetical protein A3205_05855 [Methanomassiliicoccales archaeon Mx-03]
MTHITLATCHLVTFDVLSKGPVNDADYECDFGEMRLRWHQERQYPHSVSRRKVVIDTEDEVYICEFIGTRNREVVHFYPTTFVVDPTAIGHDEISEAGLSEVGRQCLRVIAAFYCIGWAIAQTYTAPMDFVTLNADADEVEVVG